MLRRTKQRDRTEQRAARRRAHYLALIDGARTDTGRVAYAADYVRALLAGADPQVARRTARQVEQYLLSVAETLEPTKGARQ